MEGVLPFASVAQPSEAPPVASSGSQGVSSALSQGLGRALGWFDESVNVGASSSAASALAPRVFFFHPSVCWRGGDGYCFCFGRYFAAFGCFAQTAICLCSIVQKCSVPAAHKTCQVEGLFSEVTHVPKEEFAPVLFHRVAELLTEARHRFETAAAAGKAPHSSLPLKKWPLVSSSDPAFGKAASFNP